jgi:hypothetical protein
MIAEPDLFGAQLLPGLASALDIIDPSEEALLIERIDGEDLSPFRFQGWLGKRLTRSFGWSYDFDNGRFAETDPIPAWLEPVRMRAAAFAGLAPEHHVQALLIRYDPGAGIGWHRDRPVFEHVVGLSLGNEAAMRFRRRMAKGFDRLTVPYRRVRSTILPVRSGTNGSTASPPWKPLGGQSRSEAFGPDWTLFCFTRSGLTIENGKAAPTLRLSFNNGKEVVRCLIVPRRSRQIA